MSLDFSCPNPSNLSCFSQKEIELSERLGDVMRQLIDAKVEKKENDRERRLIDCIDTLEKLYKGSFSNLT